MSAPWRDGCLFACCWALPRGCVVAPLPNQKSAAIEHVCGSAACKADAGQGWRRFACARVLSDTKRVFSNRGSFRETARPIATRAVLTPPYGATTAPATQPRSPTGGSCRFPARLRKARNRGQTQHAPNGVKDSVFPSWILNRHKARRSRMESNQPDNAHASQARTFKRASPSRRISPAFSSKPLGSLNFT